jgi:hypothetical protein
MRKLIPLFLAAFSAFAADSPKLPTCTPEDKLALREAQIAVQQEQLVLLDLANQILKANMQFADRQKSAQSSQATLAAKVNEVTEKLRKNSGCKDCVINEKLEFVQPEKPATPPAKQ